MRHELSMDDDLFTSIVELLWKNSSDAIRELVENDFDADAWKVLVTFVSDGSVAVEDDAGMDAERFSKFMKVGGLHQQGEEFTPRGRRVVGKYRVGRLAALGVFGRMQVRTKREEFADSLIITYEDLRRLASGRAGLEGADLPPLKRNGTEILLTGPKKPLDFEGVRQMLSQLPILRTPGFEVHMKKTDSFGDWDFEGARRLLPKEIPGVKVPVDLPGIQGVITIADDRALPLAPEDKGVGIVVSSHLVTRTYFGFENSPHRFDRVTGWIEHDGLRMTFGAKDQIIEDLVYASFVESVREFIGKEVIPRLSDLEIHRLGRMEMKYMRKVDRRLASALAELLAERPMESLQLSGEKIPAEALRSIMTPEKVIAQTGEASTVVIEEPAAAPESPLETSRQPETQTPSIEQSPDQTGVEWTRKEERPQPPPPTFERESEPQPGQLQQTTTEAKARTDSQPSTRRVAHYLHNVGIVIIPYDDREDTRPSYSNREYVLAGHRVRAIFVNRKHPSYAKCEKDGTLVDHLLRLFSIELAGMGYEGSEPAMEFANRLYSIAVAKG
jgi:hypothetical protein